MMVVPRLEVKHRRRYAQLLQSEQVGHEDRSLVINTLLWVLAALDGVQVDGLREHMIHSPLVAKWQHVKAALERWPGGVAEARGVRRMVRGWLAASECQAEGGEKMLVDWFSGWPAVMREAAEAMDWKMVAVDNRGGLGAPHELNVMMDLLRVAPQFWRLEVARVLGVSVQRLGPNWFGIPCTTTSRGDATNSTRKKVKVWFNYRRTKHWLRDP